MMRQRRHRTIQDNLTKVKDMLIYRIEIKCDLEIGRNIVNRIENGRTVHQQLKRDTPKVLHVAEEYVKGRQDQPNADIEEGQCHYRIRKKEKPPRKINSVQDAERKKHSESQREVQKRLNILGQQEYVLGHIDLREYRRIVPKASHPFVGGFAEIHEKEIPAEEVCRVMLYGGPEKLRKDHLHH